MLIKDFEIDGGFWCFNGDFSKYLHTDHYKIKPYFGSYSYDEYVKEGRIKIIGPACLGFWSDE